LFVVLKTERKVNRQHVIAVICSTFVDVVGSYLTSAIIGLI